MPNRDKPDTHIGIGFVSFVFIAPALKLATLRLGELVRPCGGDHTGRHCKAGIQHRPRWPLCSHKSTLTLQAYMYLLCTEVVKGVSWILAKKTSWLHSLISHEVLMTHLRDTMSIKAPLMFLNAAAIRLHLAGVIGHFSVMHKWDL